jgi:DNA-binding NarL/FixJ family response regulator
MLEHPKICVLSVDDHQLLREGIAAVITAEPGMRLVGEASTGAGAIAQWSALRPDVTLMDLRLPDMTGIDAMIEIRKVFPCARIIILTTYEGDAQAQRALSAGAAGYLLKSTMRKELVSTIRLVHSGGHHIPCDVAEAIARHLPIDALSEREIQVLRLVAEGNSNRGAAVRLGVTEDTVKGHMKNILAKLQANDRTHAVTIALQRGIIDI